jgi:divalent metal cation (Fe/Co/Zn/Cd) transporter
VEPIQREAIRQFITGRPEIKQVFSLITLQMGNDIMVAVQAEMSDPDASTAVSIERINATEKALKVAFPEIRWSFFEPDDSP